MNLEEELAKAKAETAEANLERQKLLAAAVSVKLPTFWPTKADIWFARAEAEFTLKNITQDSTKYAYLVAALDNDTATRVVDFLRSPPDGNGKYEALKARLNKAFEMSDLEKADKILETNGLGDAKPSELLDKLLALVPVGMEPGFLFRRIFLRQLPSDVQGHLAQTKFTGNTAKDLRALAEEADKHFISSGARIVSASAMEEINAAQGPASRFKSGFDRKGAAAGKSAGRIPPCRFHFKFGACGFKPKVSEN